MPTLNHSHSTDALYPLTCHLDDMHSGCDPDFDAVTEELERQFAELRLSLDHA